jgi:hypothetical protein
MIRLRLKESLAMQRSEIHTQKYINWGQKGTDP